MHYIVIQKTQLVDMLIPKNDLKLHHIGTGAIISAITSFVILQLFNYYNIDSSLLILVNAILVALPTGLFVYHKKNKNKARESTSICLTSGHGVVFTLILNYIFEEGIIPILAELL